MTAEAIMVQILSEVTGKPKSRVTELLDEAKRSRPDMANGPTREYTPAEADRLMAQLRREKAGILNWLIEGATR